MRVPEGATGVLHVGGGLAQEADEYGRRKLRVLWVEPLRENVEAIQDRIGAYYPLQGVLQALLSDLAGKIVQFYVTSGKNGRSTSSSMLPLHEHRERFPHVHVREVVVMRTLTVASLQPDPELNHLVVDVQGAELLVLKGAEPVLDQFQSIQVEGSTVEMYRGQPTISEVQTWLEDRGFRFIEMDESRPSWHTDYLFKRS